MSMSPLEELRHSASHILATAVLRIFPDAKLDIGPPTDTGFYYDIDLDHKLTADDLVKLEAEMKKIADENQRFDRKEVSREEAIEIIKSRGQERYKLGRLADIPEGEKISFYQNGEFMDLCAGTHVRYSSKLKAFKLLSIAGAYHRGDEKNKQLQRIYGTAFPTKEELAQHLELAEQLLDAGATHVGAVATHCLASEGVLVTIAARNPETLKAAAAEITAATGASVNYVVADITTEAGRAFRFAPDVVQIHFGASGNFAPSAPCSATRRFSFASVLP